MLEKLKKRSTELATEIYQAQNKEMVIILQARKCEVDYLIYLLEFTELERYYS